MPDEKRDIIHYTEYFNLNAPRSSVQIAFLLAIGALAGFISVVFVHSINNYKFLLAGISAGMLIVSLPGMLTVMLVKMMNKRLQLKHALFAVNFVSFVYFLSIIVIAAMFTFVGTYPIAYVALIVLNAAIYGYWLIIGKIIIGQRRSAIFTSAFQPILNILFFIPVSGYIFGYSEPLNIALVKLYAGMFVFLGVSYFILYLLDRPAKRELNMSGIDIFSAMVSQWLYNFIKDVNLGAKQGGAKRDINISVLALKGKKRLKAVFVKPDLHYGPFAEVGGSIVPEYLGDIMFRKYGATPFVMHGAVNISNNPVNAEQIKQMGDRISAYVEKINGKSFKSAYGCISWGREEPCTAINLMIGNTSLLTLTKAPTVTEDIDKDVGLQLEAIAKNRADNVILIDAHNSRYESASVEELRGIYKGSKYVKRYESAIQKAMKPCRMEKIKFGSSADKLAPYLGSPKDLGFGYTSVGVFGIGKKRFAMIYFDANNMAPKLRSDLIDHISEKFGIAAEVYTNDTHSVNSIARPASNVLGSYTSAHQINVEIDRLVDDAIKDMEPVSYAAGVLVMNNFRVWGEGIEEAIVKASRSIIRTGKYAVPLVIAAGFIIASWIIYIV